MSEYYTYDNCPLKSLGEIRLLTITRGAGDDPIECTLESCPLAPKLQKDHKAYEALSYHWGSPEDLLEIKIYAIAPPARRLRVRQNLYSALKHLRLPDGPRTLWIDAICIDQGNTGEQNSQVSMMAKIYSEATRVCVWLGPASEDSDSALSFISRVTNLDDFDRLATDPNDSKAWGALSSLMKRKWFSRRWVIQEIALARRATLYCGGATEVEWSKFAVAVSLFEAAETKARLISKSIMNSPFYNHVPDFLGEIKSLGATRLVDATNNLFRKSTTGHVLERLSSLDTLIANLVAFQASRPHDVIYAVLALAKGTHMAAKRDGLPHVPNEIDEQTSIKSEPIPMTFKEKGLAKLVSRKWEGNAQENRFIIDYERPFFDVCKDFLKFTIHHSKSLDIICRPWVPNDGFPKGVSPPSWLLTMAEASFGLRPDGSYSRKYADTLVGTPGLGKRNYNASGAFDVTPEWKFGTGKKDHSMNVEGFVVDEIGKITLPAMEGIIPHEWLEAGGWEDSSASGALPPDAFWRTLVADRDSNGSNPPAFYPHACQSASLKSVEGSHISTTTIIQTGKSEIVADFLRRVHEVIWMRRLIKTTHGLLGLAPAKTEPGDIICIFYGCSVPVVLRELTDATSGETHYTFVGECYVHTIMDGEAFEMVRSRSPEKTIDKKVFELR